MSRLTKMTKAEVCAELVETINNLHAANRKTKAAMENEARTAARLQNAKMELSEARVDLRRAAATDSMHRQIIHELSISLRKLAGGRG